MNHHRYAFAVVVGLGCATQFASGDLLYELEALEGQLAGSHLTGRIRLPDSMTGATVWAIGSASGASIASDFGPGYSWNLGDVSVSDDVAFAEPVGAPILTPIPTGGTVGYAPDWRFDTTIFAGGVSAGLGADIGQPLWNLVELGAPGNLDIRNIPGLAGEPQWRLVLVPALSTGAIAVLGFLGIMRRRRR